jgi:autotransporter-associated beta strand protein
MGGNISNSFVIVGFTSGGTGILNFGNGSSVGTLHADTILGGNGTAVVNFNHTGNYVLNPKLEGSLAVNKFGPGTTILSGNNTYTGTTSVNAGSLLINGDQSVATGAVQVAVGAMLGGSGIVGGNATIGGILSPGNGPSVLTFAHDLTFQNTAVVTMELNGNAYDRINIGGTSTYGGNMVIQVGSDFIGSNNPFSLFTMSASTGNFSAIRLSGLYSGDFTNASGVWALNDSSGNTWTFSQNSGDLSFTAVPETSTWVLFSIFGFFAFLWNSNAKRRHSSRVRQSE